MRRRGRGISPVSHLPPWEFPHPSFNDSFPFTRNFPPNIPKYHHIFVLVTASYESDCRPHSRIAVMAPFRSPPLHLVRISTPPSTSSVHSHCPVTRRRFEHRLDTAAIHDLNFISAKKPIPTAACWYHPWHDEPLPRLRCLLHCK